MSNNTYLARTLNIKLSGLNLSKDKKEAYKRILLHRVDVNYDLNSKPSFLGLSYKQNELLRYIIDSDLSAMDRMRKKIIGLSITVNLCNADDDSQKKVFKINKFLEKRGAHKKSLNKLSQSELNDVVSQMEKIRDSGHLFKKTL